MQYWKAHYKDLLHDTDIEIVNTEEDYCADPLSFTLEGITFRGTSLGDFRLADEAQYDYAKEKFCLLKWGGHNTEFNLTTPYLYELQRYALRVEIPIRVVRKKDNRGIQGILHLAFEYVEHDREKKQSRLLCDDQGVYRDDEKVLEFALEVEGKRYSSTKKTLYFEAVLEDFSEQMKHDYYIKCCFTCQYSDYSPYGNDDYGLMLCYRRHKEACLKVNSKQEFFQYLEMKDYDGRQETYLCEEYDIRSKSSGYRGFVAGVLD